MDRDGDLRQSDGAGVGEDPKVDHNVWEVEPNEESEKSEPQPRPLYPDGHEEWRQGQHVHWNNGSDQMCVIYLYYNIIVSWNSLENYLNSSDISN